MKNKVILLVDADGDCEEVVSLAAAETDHDLRRVKTSREAFRVLGRQLKELAAVIVDVDPGAHGLALLEAVSGCAERPPLLVLTALEETYMKHIARKHGATACLGKPISSAKLRTALGNVSGLCSLSSDCWGHVTAPPVDKGFKVRAAALGISRKMSIAPTKRGRLSAPGTGLRKVKRADESIRKRAIRNILVPIDFSPLSMEAIAVAQSAARSFGATIHLAHVHQAQYPATFLGPIFSAGRRAISFEEHRRETLRKMLEETALRGDLPTTGTTHLCEGAVVFDEVCRLAETLPADLIVMPTHGRTGLKHAFLGSTAERVVQHAPCPVLVVRKRAAKSKGKLPAQIIADRMKTILVPIDFSDTSRQALEYAIEFARRISARLIIFHADYRGEMASADGLGMERIASLTKLGHEEAVRQMEKFVRLVKFGGVKHETVVQTSRPVSGICDFAVQHDVDLIIIATHGRTGFEHLMIGSVAEQVVRRAGRSVLVVPSHSGMRMAGLTSDTAGRASPKKAASMLA